MVSKLSPNGQISRRAFCGFCALGAGVFMLGGAMPVFAAQEAPKAAKKPLVAYFSQSGNTKQIAEDIHKLVGGDIVRIETVAPYPDVYKQLTDQAKKEQEENARPAIRTKLPNLDEYGVIFLGYPNWWSSMPMPVYTFIEQNRLDGKTIAPFVTHGGGQLGHSIEDLKKLVPHSKILKPVAVNGNFVSRAEGDIKKWLEGLGPALIETTTGNPAIYPDGAY